MSRPPYLATVHACIRTGLVLNYKGNNLIDRYYGISLHAHTSKAYIEGNGIIIQDFKGISLCRIVNAKGDRNVLDLPWITPAVVRDQDISVFPFLKK